MKIENMNKEAQNALGGIIAGDALKDRILSSAQVQTHEMLSSRLPQAAQKGLQGLSADTALLARIRIAAADEKALRKKTFLRILKPALAACAALVLCVGAVTSLTQKPWISSPHTDEAPLSELAQIGSAGNVMTRSAETDDVDLIADLPDGAVVMSAGRQSSVEYSLFAQGSGNAFPLVLIGGKAYRMQELTIPVTEDMLGDALGEITEFTREPALATADNVSNVVSCGETVYAVKGYENALAAAKTPDGYRLFQRFAFAGKAIMGNESLRDVLCEASDVEWISCRGSYVDGAEAQALAKALLEGAQYLSSATTGDDIICIGTRTGYTLQLMTTGDMISACGTWSCPDFFEAFE